MFTGIIKSKGEVKKLEKKSGILAVTILAPKNWKFENGESVSVSGICSTVIKSKKNIFEVEYIKETLSKTNVKEWRSGKITNLEKSLKFGDKIDGHLVYGHVDTVGKIVTISKSDSQLKIKVKLPVKFLKFVVYKGSVAIDGVSLTVSKKGKDFFEVSLIPYTQKHTTLGDLKKGDSVNIETDALLKYRSGITN